MGLGTSVFFKPTDTHALLHKRSFHPQHTFRGIVKSQLIRFYRICTRAEDAEKATKVLFKTLVTRGYSRTFLRNIRTQVRGEREKCIVKTQSNIIPFVTTFCQSRRNLQAKIKTNFTTLTDKLPEMSEFKVISAYRRNKNLSDFLIHSTLKDFNVKQDPDKLRTFFETPLLIYNKYTSQTSMVNGKFTLDTPNSVYVIRCTRCDR